MKLNLGKALERIEDRRVVDRCTSIVEVKPLSEPARVKLLGRLEKVKNGYKQMLEECE